MAALFFHFEAYAAASSGNKPNIAGVVGEACRLPGFAPHVENPQAPKVFAGCHPSEIPKIISDRTAGAKGITGATITIRSLTLFTVVTSWPIPRNAVMAEASSKLDYVEWRKANLAYLRRWLGASLVSVIEHRDEEFLHLHAYAVPMPEDGVFGIETISKPHCEQLKVQRAGGTRREQRIAFRAEARKLQDNYYRLVGSPFGFDRYGPKRKRLTRAELRARENEKRLMAEAQENRVKEAIEEAAKQSASAMQQQLNDLELYKAIAISLGKELASRGLQHVAMELSQKVYVQKRATPPTDHEISRAVTRTP